MSVVLAVIAAAVAALLAYGFGCDACRRFEALLWRRDERAALARLRGVYSGQEGDPLERLWRLPCAPDPRRRAS